jgi:hypothetical protein
MKRHQFTSIEQVREAYDLLQSGTRVASRIQGFYRIELFQLPDCYLEVYRHNHFNVVIKVNRFTDTAYLEPYLQDISLSGLFA